MKLPTSKQKGFTLLEVLLVIAILAILAAIVIVAINPGKQLADSRDAQRRADVNTILNAVYQYSIDNDGDLPGPSTIPAATEELCRSGSGLTPDCTGLIDLSDVTANETYLVSLPFDPQETNTNQTGYEIRQTGNGRVTVSAPLAENGTISVTR